MDFLAHNYTAIIALVTAIVALLGVYLQRRRDAVEEVSKRIDAAAKIVKAATDLTGPLDKRISDLERDNGTLKDIVRQQSDSYDNLATKYDQVMFELRAVRADRDNLLTERVLYQKRVDEQIAIIKSLECRVGELERELAALRKAQCE